MHTQDLTRRLPDGLRWLTAGLITGLIFAAVGTSIARASDLETPRIVVSYADLDVSRADGVKVLYRRIQAAAANVCEEFDGRRLEQKILFRNCKLDATNNAVASVSLPALSDIHAARVGAPLQRTQQIAGR